MIMFAWRWYQNNTTLVRLKYIALFISYLNSMKRIIVLLPFTGATYDGAIMGFCSSVPLAWKHLGVLSTNGCGRLSHIRILSGKKKCLYVEVLAYWTRNRTMAMGDVVCSSSGGFATRSFTIMYIITAAHVVLLSDDSCHCSVFSIIDVTLLLYR